MGKCVCSVYLLRRTNFTAAVCIIPGTLLAGCIPVHSGNNRHIWPILVKFSNTLTARSNRVRTLYARGTWASSSQPGRGYSLGWYARRADGGQHFRNTDDGTVVRCRTQDYAIGREPPSSAPVSGFETNERMVFRGSDVRLKPSIRGEQLPTKKM